MKTYRVVRQCHGFKKRMWNKDQIVVLEDHEQPPCHFQLIEGGVVETPKPIEPDVYPLSKLGEIPPVIGGFGASLPGHKGNLETIAPVIKRGRSKKAS